MARRGKGEGSVFYDERRGRWVALATYYAEGRRKRKWVSARTRTEAVQRLRQVLAQLDQGRPPVPERLTLGAYLTHWLETCARPSLRPRTYHRYAQLVRRHIIPALGRRPLARLSPLDVQRFLTQTHESGLSARTVQFIRAVLRRALGQAEKWGLVGRNVARLVEPPKGERPAVRPLTIDEARCLLQTVTGDRLEALYVLALALGLRQGEILGLRWEDVDLERGLLTVHHQLQRVDGRLQLVPLKTERSRRTLPLPPVVQEALRRHRARQKEERLQAGPAWIETGFVFTTTVGTPLDARNLVRHYHGLLARAGLPRRRFHDLRHTAASLLLAMGTDLRVVQQVLGHSQIAVTADTYAHLLPPVLQAAAQKMEALFRGRDAIG